MRTGLPSIEPIPTTRSQAAAVIPRADASKGADARKPRSSRTAFFSGQRPEMRLSVFAADPGSATW